MTATPPAWETQLDCAAPILVTGAAGFIGYFLSERLLQAGFSVVGIDNLNDYYDPTLKEQRLQLLRQRAGFRFVRVDFADRDAMTRLFSEQRFPVVAHLGAQAGVRYSIDHPHVYADSNLSGFVNILEGCRRSGTHHLVYASSSSVYGGNTRLPFSTGDSVDHPVSLYAATKKANELMAHAYAHLYGLPSTGLRFFTVYGPLGRPDMAYFKFADAISKGRPITIYNNGDMRRDFTYIDDVVEGLVRLLPRAPVPDPDFDATNPHPARSWAAHRIFNIGARRSEPLLGMIDLLEQFLERAAIREYLPMQPGDVKETWADVADLEAEIGAMPSTSLTVGLERFVDWFRDYTRDQ